jgi:hypothetical protein
MANKVDKVKAAAPVARLSEAKSSGSMPTPGAPAKVIESIKLPPSLTGDENAEIVITFSSRIDYVKIKFELKNENLDVDCEGKINKACTYEFNFGKNGGRAKSFGVRARMVKEESREPIRIFYSTKKDAELTEGEVWWLLLKPAPKFGQGNAILKGFADSFQWVLHMTRRQQGKKRYFLRYPILITAGILALFYFNVLPEDIQKWFRDKTDYVQINWIGNKPPRVYTGAWPNLLEAGLENRPSSSAWDLVPKEWSVVNNFLHIKGEGIGFVRTPVDLNAPYNYTLNFRLTISSGQRTAAWVLRANDERHYYLFVLNLPPEGSKGAKLEGWVCDGEKQEPLPNVQETPTSIDYYHFEDGDLLTVKVDAVNNEFKHTITLTLKEPEGNPNDRYFDARPFHVNFFDARNLYPYGTAGFKAGAKDNEVVIDAVSIANVK